MDIKPSADQTPIQWAQQGTPLVEIGRRLGANSIEASRVLVDAGVYDMWLKTTRSQQTDRHTQLAFFADQGIPQTEIAQQMNLSNERVRQLLVAHGLHARWQQAQDRRQQTLTQRRQLAQLARPGRRPHPQGFRYSPQVVLDCLSQTVQAIGQPLSCVAYERYRKDRMLPGGLPWPSHQQALKYFRTWAAACRKANIIPGHGRPAYQQVFTDTHIRQSIAAYVWDSLDSCLRPTLKGYEKWARDSEGVPSLSLARTRDLDLIDVLDRAKVDWLARRQTPP